MDAKALIKGIKESIEPEVFSKIEASLIEMERGVDSLNKEVAVLNKESASRRIENNTLKKQVEEKDLKISDLSNSSEYDKKITDLTAENESLKTFQTEVYKNRRKEFSDLFQKYSEHPDFEKAKNQLTLPEPKEDGNYDFTQIENDKIVSNVSKIKEYEALGLFGTKKTEDSTLPKVGKTNKPYSEMTHEEYVAGRDTILGGLDGKKDSFL